MPTLEHANQLTDQPSPLVPPTRPFRPPLPELAGAVSRDFSVRTAQGELADFDKACQQEMATLAQDWVPVGQVKTVPKRLVKNLRYFYRDYVIFAWNSQPDVTSEVKLLVRSIRQAIDRVKATREPIASTTNFNRQLHQKAVTFLKRLAHDKTFDASAIGANKYRHYVVESKLKARLQRPICDEQAHDLSGTWQVKRVRSQQELLDIGKALVLCVGRKNEQTQHYFRSLVTKDSEFWQLLCDGHPKGLFEVHCNHQYRECPDLKLYRCVGEFDGYSHRLLKLPYEIATDLVQTLKIHPLSALPLFKSGAFPSFILGVKDRDQPDFSIVVGNFVYRGWITGYELIMSRVRSSASGVLDTGGSTAWGYFFMSANDVTLGKGRASGAHVSDLSPSQIFETSQQTIRQHPLSEINAEEALAVLVARILNGLC